MATLPYKKRQIVSSLYSRAKDRSEKQGKERRSIISSRRASVVPVNRSEAKFALAALTNTNKYFDSARYIELLQPLNGNAWSAIHALNPNPAGALFTPTQGTGSWNVVGRRCLVKAIRIRGLIWRDPVYRNVTSDLGSFNATGGGVSPIKLVLVQDTQTQGVAFNPGILYFPKPFNETEDVAFNYPQNVDSMGRFKVLRNMMVNHRSQTHMDGTYMSREASFTPFKLTYTFKKPVLVSFKANMTGAIADIIDNSFHLLGGDGGGINTPATRLQYSCRVVFCEDSG